MLLDKSLFYIYLLAIFSLFLPFTLYPVFFVLFTVLAIAYLFLLKQVRIINLSLFFWMGIFSLLGTFSTLLNIAYSDYTQYVKLIVNFSFLLSFYIFLDTKKEIFLLKKNMLIRLLEIIIFLMFIQVFINVYLMDLWTLPFVGVKNSMEAYLIVEPTMFFGSKEKNIWATKFVFITIMYFSIYINNIFTMSKLKLIIMTFFVLFNVLYTFSRTAQLMFVIFLFSYGFWKILFVYRTFFLKVFSITILFIVSIGVGFVIYDKLLHITLSAGDGLAARFELWQALSISFDKLNIWIGNGFLFGQFIISKYTTWGNNNFHNVFMNIFVDLGLLGVFSYLAILKNIFIPRRFEKIRSFVFFVLFPPFFLCVNSQYLGFDSDIVIYFSLIALLWTLKKYGVEKPL